ncbi:MAG: ATPase [Bacillota bacterium]
MDSLALLDRLEALVSEAARVPLTSKVIVDEESVYALIDDLRATIPDEVKQAKMVAKERERLLEEAKKEAEEMVREAEAEVAKKADESAVTAQAKAQADDIINQARRVAQEIRQGANDYAASVLEKLEGHLMHTLEAVKNGVAELRVTPGVQPPPGGGDPSAGQSG